MLYLGFCSLLPAQAIRFSKHFDFSGNGDGVGMRVIVLPHGYAMLSLQDCTPQTDWNYCTALTITDTLGEVLQQKIFRRLRFEGLRYHPQDSTFLLWGDFRVAGEDYAPCMLKVNYEGDTLWSMSVNPPNVDFCRQMLELPDKSIMMSTCSRYTTGNDATVIKTDSVGNLLWVKGYDTGNYFKSYDVQGLMAWQDSTVLLCANGQFFDTFDDNFFSSGVALFQTDYDGNLRYDTAYRLETVGNYAYPKIAMIPGGRIVTSSNNELLGPVNGGNNLLAINMDDHSIDWTLGFTESGDNALINNLSTTLDSGIVVSGSTFTEVFPNNHPCAWIFKADAEGQLEWQRFIPRTLSYSINDIKPTPDGGYILVGRYADSDDNFRNYVSLIKIDGRGCLQPNCDSLLVTTAAEEPAPGVIPTVLKIQPNPADFYFMVNTEELDAGRIRVVDLMGYIVTEIPISGNKTTIPVSHCVNGLYAVQYLDAKGKMQGAGRIVVQH